MLLILKFITVFTYFQDENTKEDYGTMLTSYWNRFLEILPQILIAIIVLIIFFIIAGIAGRTLKKNLLRRMSDQLLPTFLGKIARWSIIIIGFFMALNVLGFGGVASGLIAGLGASALIVGFAFKDIGENFLAGMILAFNRPFDIGDAIVSQDFSGSVQAVDMRMTTIKTFDGNDVFIPNAMIIKNPLLNYSRSATRRHEFVVGIEYAADLSKAIQTLQDLLNEHTEILIDPPPEVIFDNFGSSAINVIARFWVDNSELKRSQFDVKSDIIRITKEKFDEAGIEIPFDILQLQIHDKDQPIPLTVEKNYRESKIS
jgi:small conductance mechanosensitive channel